MGINTDFIRRCLNTLEAALKELKGTEPEGTAYDIYRAACVKEFELILELSGKLLKRRLADFFMSRRQLDELAFKDLFRHAAKHGIIEAEACERWLEYRDNRNNTAHNYAEGFAETTLKLLPDFIEDAKALTQAVEEAGDG
ncbi:MAG: nucleotidyltransferase substrate binding protein [Gammaproteobacteria bacterium]|nr:nucleotidyltransferase substrate binding protein [Gammaproteobacteria bacterium]